MSVSLFVQSLWILQLYERGIHKTPLIYNIFNHLVHVQSWYYVITDETILFSYCSPSFYPIKKQTKSTPHCVINFPLFWRWQRKQELRILEKSKERNTQCEVRLIREVTDLDYIKSSVLNFFISFSTIIELFRSEGSLFFI